MSMRVVDRKGRFGDRSGVAVGFVALLLIALLGMAALAVDGGMLLAARTEAQRVADAASLAGALALYETGGEESAARGTAIDYAARNTIRNTGAEVLTEDVDVELNRWLVRVRVFRTTERENPMVNLFARAIGIPTTDVSAAAAARMAPATGVNCLLPFVMPDRWWEGGYPNYPGPTDHYDAAAGDVYVPWRNQDGSFNDPFSGYSRDDKGYQIRLRTSDPNEAPKPGIYYPIRFPTDGPTAGTSRYEARIRGCTDEGANWEVNGLVDPEPGNFGNPTARAFNDLINQDPSAFWNTDRNCVSRTGEYNEDGQLKCVSSYRIRPVAMFDPREFPLNPSDQFRIRNFAGVFVERVEGNGPSSNIIVRFVDYRGANPAPPDQDPPQSILIRVLQLVE